MRSPRVPADFFDKVPIKRNYKKLGVRCVPPGVARYGSFLGRGAILMPGFVNIGAYVDEGTMVDTWATVGSCAQIGKGVHLSGGVGIGGVLEPPQARARSSSKTARSSARAASSSKACASSAKPCSARASSITASTPIVDVRGERTVDDQRPHSGARGRDPGHDAQAFPGRRVRHALRAGHRDAQRIDRQEDLAQRGAARLRGRRHESAACCDRALADSGIAAKKRPGVDRSWGWASRRCCRSSGSSMRRRAAIGEFGMKYTANAGDPGAARADRAALRLSGDGCRAQRLHHDRLARGDVRRRSRRCSIRRATSCWSSSRRIRRTRRSRSSRGSRSRSVGMPAATGSRYDAEAIVAALSPATRLIVIGSPSNPTGRVSRRADAQRLAAALRARGGRTGLGAARRTLSRADLRRRRGSLAAAYPYTIAVNGLSNRTRSPGCAIGWSIAPAPLSDELVKVHAWLVTAANTFGQRVALRIFTEPGALGEQAAWYRERRVAVLAALRESGLTFVEPDGAFYACVKLPHGSTRWPRRTGWSTSTTSLRSPAASSATSSRAGCG